MEGKREQRQWWTSRDGVKEVTGYGCGPGYPGYWWCPGVGYSLVEGITLFETEREALEHRAAELDQQISKLMAEAAGVQRRLG